MRTSAIILLAGAIVYGLRLYRNATIKTQIQI
jgi:hypothetical protein